MRIKYTLIGLAALLAAGCRTEEPVTIPEYDVMPYRPDTVALQNLQSRVLVYCYDSPESTAQECAEKFEKDGYVRLKDIPSRPAQYDFLTEGTYPTRRWRNGELVSRW